MEEKQRCFVGFDGFIDTLAKVVKSRVDTAEEKHIETFATIDQWSKNLQLAAGKSCNYELAFSQRCAGGNAINLGRALAALDHDIFWAANVADPSDSNRIDPVFTPFTFLFKEGVNLGIAGQTHALEFNDGKLLLGIQGKNASLTLENVEHFLGPNWQEKWIWNQDLICLVNWTMTPGMGQIWKYLANNPPQAEKRRAILIDLADPRKRSPEELAHDIQLLSPLKKHNVSLILSCNKSEAEQTLTALGGQTPAQNDLEKEISLLANEIRQKLPSFVIVIHDSKLSVMCTEEGTTVCQTKTVKSPKVLTGGGDHFNAGLAHAWLLEKNPVDSLQIAMKCAGYYIENGQSPTRCKLNSID